MSTVPKTYRPWYKSLNILISGGPGEKHTSVLKGLSNHHLTIQYYKAILLEVASLLRRSQIQTRTNSDKERHSTVPKTYRPFRQFRLLIRATGRDFNFHSIGRLAQKQFKFLSPIQNVDRGAYYHEHTLTTKTT